MISKTEIEKLKTQAFAEAIAELKQEFSNNFDKISKLNQIVEVNQDASRTENQTNP